MRIQHYLTSAAAIALIAGFAASSASADVVVTATVDKTKTVTVDINHTKDIDVDIDAELDLELDRGAVAMAIANQLLQDNTTEESVGHEATTTGSANLNTGLVQWNQAAGFLNQQGNLIAAAIDGDADTDAFAEAENSAQQVLGPNTLEDFEGGNIALLDGSMNDNTGVAHGNQAAGDMNQQLNSLSLAIAFAGVGEDALAVSEADLGQFLQTNTVEYEGDGETATITGSLNNNTGIVGFNQAAGAFNQQANLVSVSATAPATATLLTP
jgi:hypothetical protein